MGSFEDGMYYRELYGKSLKFTKGIIHIIAILVIGLSNTQLNASVICEDTVQIDITQRCGDAKGLAIITANNIQCLGEYQIFLENPDNYVLTQGLDFNPGDLIMEIPINVDVVDKTRPASCTLVVVTGAGTYKKRILNYYTGLLDVRSIDFGTILYGNKYCRSVSIINTGKIKTLYIQKVSSKKCKYVFQKLPLVLYPGDTLRFDICLTPNQYGEIYDTVRFSVAYSIGDEECFELPDIPIHAYVEEPLLLAMDHDYGYVRIGDSLTYDIVLKNVGPVNIILDSLSLYGKISKFRFSYSTAIIIPPGDSIVYPITYMPGYIYGVKDSMWITYHTNASRIKTFSLLTGEVVHSILKISDVRFTERVIDNWQISNGVSYYTSNIKIAKYGNDSIHINKVQLLGPDSNSFQIDSIINVLNYLNSDGVLYSRDSLIYNMPIIFKPMYAQGRTSERFYVAKLAYEYLVGKEIIKDTSDIMGVALQPRLSTTGNIWRNQKIGDTSTRTIVIYNKDSRYRNSISKSLNGSYDMTIYKLKLPALSKFMWLNNTDSLVFNPPIKLVGGDSLSIDVRFSSNVLGQWSDIYNVIYDGDMVSESKLEANTIQDPEVKLLNVYIKEWYNDSVIVQVPVTSKYDVSMFIDHLETSDTNVFKLLSMKDSSISINAGDTSYVKIMFKPLAVTSGGIETYQDLRNRLPYQDSSFKAILILTDTLTNTSDTSNIIGDGKYLELSTNIPDVNNINIGDMVDIYHTFDNSMDALDSADVMTFKSEIHYDTTMLFFTGYVVRSGTQVENWTIDSISSSNGIVTLSFSTSIKADHLSAVNKPIYGLRFLSLLSATKESVIAGELNTEIDHIVETDSAGIVKLNPNCGGLLRMIEIADSQSLSLISSHPLIIRYAVGLPGVVKINAVNLLGQTIELLNEYQKSGSYELLVDDVKAYGLYILKYYINDVEVETLKIIKN